MILSYTLIFLISQLQTQKLMIAQISSYIEYVKHIINIIVLIL